MAQRITSGMLASAVAAYARTLSAHELSNGSLQYTTGSPTNGVAWSVRYEDGSSPVGIDMGVLGWTAREAYERLHTIIRVLNDISFRNEAL